MEKWLDLHMHSAYSNDGDFSPAEMMRKCAAAGLKVVALADHNSVRGVSEARETALRLGMKFFSALEIDCTHGGHNFHLLGYGINERAAVFAEIEQKVHREEVAASEKLIELVQKMGIFVDVGAVRKKAVNGVVVAEIIAEVALADSQNSENLLLLPFRAGGERSDNPYVNFYWDLCSQGKPAYVPMHYIELTAAVAAIKENGGAAVLAHPGANIGQNGEITKSIINAGIDGIEAFSNYHDEETKRFYEVICQEHNLITTSGSDFHGKSKPAIHLGKLENPAPQEVYERLTAIIRERGGRIN
jgi:predicted metal-dependent phosphoesterase TrpH